MAAIIKSTTEEGRVGKAETGRSPRVPNELRNPDPSGLTTDIDVRRRAFAWLHPDAIAPEQHDMAWPIFLTGVLRKMGSVAQLRSRSPDQREVRRLSARLARQRSLPIFG